MLQIEQEKLMSNAAEVGNYIMSELKKIPQIQNVRGRGLMIGFDVPEELKDLMTKSGFERVRFRLMTLNYVALHIGVRS